MRGEYGVKNFYVGVPVIIGKKGVEKVIEVKLNSEEKKMFVKSVKSVKNLINIVKKIKTKKSKMNIHEYQAKKLFREYGLNILKGNVAFSSDEAVDIAKKIDSSKWVVKAQIHAGGRGKGGGIKIAKIFGRSEGTFRVHFRNESDNTTNWCTRKKSS